MRIGTLEAGWERYTEKRKARERISVCVHCMCVCVCVCVCVGVLHVCVCVCIACVCVCALHVCVCVCALHVCVCVCVLHVCVLHVCVLHVRESACAYIHLNDLTIADCFNVSLCGCCLDADTAAGVVAPTEHFLATGSSCIERVRTIRCTLH